MTARRIRAILAALLAAISMLPGAGGRVDVPAAPAEHRGRVLPRGLRPLLHHEQPGGDRRARFGPHNGVDAHRPRIPGVRGRGRVCVRQSGVPLLHSAGTRRFALLLGVARRMPGGARQDRRRPELQRLHLRVAERVLRRAARHDDRRVPGEHGAGVPAVEPARRLEPSLHDRPRHQGGDAGEGVSRRRLRSCRGEPVLDRRRARRCRHARVGTLAVRGGMRGRARDRRRRTSAPKWNRGSPSIRPIRTT